MILLENVSGIFVVAAKSITVAFPINRCSEDRIHKDLRNAIGSSSIISYNEQTHQLVVLVGTQNQSCKLVSKTHTQVEVKLCLLFLL